MVVSSRFRSRHLLRDERGVALIFALLIALVVSVGLLLATQTITLEFDSARNQQARSVLQDTADSITGLLVAKAQPATLPLDAASGPDKLQYISSATGRCNRIWLDRNSGQVKFDDAATCAGLPGTTRVLAIRIVNPATQPLFTYYSGAIKDAAEVLPGPDYTTAQSVDVNISVNPSVLNGGGTYKTSFHMRFGGVIITSEIQDNAITAVTLAPGTITPSQTSDNDVLQSVGRIPLASADPANYGAANGEQSIWRNNADSPVVPTASYTLKTTTAHIGGSTCPANSDEYDMADSYVALDDSTESSLGERGAFVRFCSPALAAGTVPAGNAVAHLYFANSDATNACAVTLKVWVNGSGSAYTALVNGASGIPANSSTSLYTTNIAIPALTFSANDQLVFDVSFADTAACNDTTANTGTTLSFGGSGHPSRLILPGQSLPAGDAAATLVPVNWNNYCLPGRVLEARALFMISNRVDNGEQVVVQPRLYRFSGPTVLASTALPNYPVAGGTAEFTPAAVTVGDGASALAASAWTELDDGTCNGSYGPWTVAASQPFWYQVQTSAHPATPFTVPQAAIEYRYGG